VVSTVADTVTCTLTLDATQLDTETFATAASSHSEVLLHGSGTSTTAAGLITVACSGTTSTFSDANIQAVDAL
jgi:hypothetical protein